MNHRNTLKSIGLAILISTGLCMAEGSYFAGVADAAVSAARKGLPLSMLITADELRQKQTSNQRFILFDSRSRVAYDHSHIKGALHAPAQETALAAYMKSYPKSTSVVAYCGSGGCQASAVTVLTLRRLGFSDSKNMEEGFEEWEKKGYPVER